MSIDAVLNPLLDVNEIISWVYPVDPGPRDPLNVVRRSVRLLQFPLGSSQNVPAGAPSPVSMYTQSRVVLLPAK